jgi:hypothetical protein
MVANSAEVKNWSCRMEELFHRLALIAFPESLLIMPK